MGADGMHLVIFIRWQERQPILLISRQLNPLLFAIIGILTGVITLIWQVKRWRAQRIRLSDARTLEELMALSPKEFEKLIATLFKAYGHQAQVLGGSADHGVDILVLSNENEKWVV
jgi:HJR/Mrr/RecB family endonuclease